MERFDDFYKTPHGIQDLPCGPEADKAIEQLVMQDKHWEQGWDPYRNIPNYTTDDAAALECLMAACQRIVDHRKHAMGEKDPFATTFDLRGNSDGSYSARVGGHTMASTGKTVAKAAYAGVASYLKTGTS